MLDFSRCRLAPFAHQREDVQALLDHPFYFIGSEMRTGKSKIVIDAAQFLFEDHIIEKVLVIAPAPVRDVWYDPTLGEIAKHAWDLHPATVSEFHAKHRSWFWGDPRATTPHRLEWLVTNYEFLRAKTRLIQLLPFCGPKTLLVLDESSFVKNHAAAQTKACMELRKQCGRVVLLNGTPISHSPLDLFSQGNLLNRSVLDCQYVTHFKARYAVQTPLLKYNGKPMTNQYGRTIQKITGWRDLDELQRRFAPYTVRRLQKTCLDLPPKLDPVTLTATLTPETWKTYKAMRDEMVVWLQSGDVATSQTAAVKVLRLAQITSGFLGGIEDPGITPRCGGSGMIEIPPSSPGPGEGEMCPGCDDCDPRGITTTQELSHEKLDVLLWFIESRLEADPNLHLVVWCRFRPELFRLLDVVHEKFPRFEVASIVGGQKKPDRLRALGLLKPETSPKGPVFVGGTYGTGSFGLDFTAAHTSVNLSFDYSLGKYLQSADRVYGPGQTEPVAYFDIVATGPSGQKTVDHAVVAARRARQDLATWTVAEWVKALEEE